MTGKAPRLRDMDVQFSLDGVSDLPLLFQRRAEAAQSALNRWPVHHALRYGPKQGETLNLFPADSAQSSVGGAPVLFFIHGGFWRSLDADLFSFLADGFVPFGAMLVVIDYPLMPDVRLADVLASCARALHWTHANVADYGGDPNRITICGNSAGGHLVAELACADAPHSCGSSAQGAGIPIAAAVPISGIYDLEPVTRSFQDDSLTLTASEVADFSPLTRRYRSVVPMLVAVGADETTEFLRQTDAFADLCTRAGQPSEALHVPGTNHVSVLTEALAVPDHSFNRRVRALMGLAV
ncbi:alpha/beta hydrolase [Tianweitania sp. BSSL-BM11]|uniref:Alpha/beta hydrolase n=1 Tax=Tianweitania aestuarii TaxID=2814886 RepID=A0ABS5RXT6_9HYPH|nr:alpha/beta hydrolase [Tianweitania aestuarii]MBS9721853.1 alpha/beta hydrolase [Tianweitania aestuarii]